MKIDVPALKAQYQVRVREGEGVFLLSEYGNHILTGRANELVIPLINGERSSADIANSLEEELPREEVYYTLNQLEKQSFLVAANDSLSLGETAFYNY